MKWFRDLIDKLGDTKPGVKIDDETRMYTTSRDSFRFIEGDHELEVYADRGRNPDYIIELTSFRKWLPPHENEPITEADRERIIKKVTAYFDRCGNTWRLE